jgi:hypothetical protein
MKSEIAQRKCLSRDHGAVAVVVVVMVLVFVGFAALVVDMGYNYTMKRQLQAAADAAALAGCQELILGHSDAQILAVVESYAATNSVVPAERLSVVPGPPNTYVNRLPEGSSPSGDNYEYVHVTVRQPAELFFGVAARESDQPLYIEASARARVSFLTGARGLVPFSLPLLDATNVTVEIDDSGVEIEMEEPETEDGPWTKAITADSARSSGYRIAVRAYGEHDEPIGIFRDGQNDPSNAGKGNAATFLVRDDEAAEPNAASVVRAVELDDNFFRARPTGTGGLHQAELKVRLDGEPTAVRAGVVGQGPTVQRTLAPVSGQPGWWHTNLPVADTYTPELYAVRKVNLSVEYADATFAVSDIARLVVRRSTFPIAEVSTSSSVVEPGDAITISVKLHRYEFNDSPSALPYEMKVSSNANDVGNFGALNFNTLNGLSTGGGADAYRNYVAVGYPDPSVQPPPPSVKIGDWVYGENGNMVGPTDQGLYGGGGIVPRVSAQDRDVTYAQWLQRGRPASSRVVYVPLTEAMPNQGLPKFRIVGFASFYIAPESPSGWVFGHFLEYLLPSDDLDDERPEKLYISVPRLVTPPEEFSN